MSLCTLCSCAANTNLTKPVKYNLLQFAASIVKFSHEFQLSFIFKRNLVLLLPFLSLFLIYFHLSENKKEFDVISAGFELESLKTEGSILDHHHHRHSLKTIWNLLKWTDNDRPCMQSHALKAPLIGNTHTRYDSQFRQTKKYKIVIEYLWS